MTTRVRASSGERDRSSIYGAFHLYRLGKVTVTVP